ncbi:MAG: hypothetical protein KGO82_00630 [Bacteroidota bacterium]|nr:hypothetical protein [Bacteroidota bacterium]
MSLQEHDSNNTERTLHSLDGLQKASPGPFFYTRVQARLQREQPAGWLGRMVQQITRPAVVLTTLAIILLLNAAVLWFEKPSEQPVNNEDYNTTLAANSYYDENPDAR